jgi:hypothetical protein
MSIIPLVPVSERRIGEYRSENFAFQWLYKWWLNL